jgi:ABC-type glycerol-3-phosphate transport system substrate-binding protein
MVSKNADTDLYIVNSAGAYQDIREKGYAAPMNANATLLAQAKEFYPAIQSALFEGDSLLAFPLNVSPDTWTLNRTVWEDLALGEYPATFDAFFKAVEDWDEKYASDNPDYTLLESHEGFLGFAALIVKQYLLQHETENAPVSFDDPAFREAAQAALSHRETIDSQEGGPSPIIMTYNQYLGVGYNDSDEVISIPPPALSENSPRMVKASMDLFILNPLSKNDEAALEFIAFYAGQMSETAKYALNASLDTPLRPVGFETAQQELKERVALLEAMLDKAAPEEKGDLQTMIDQDKKRYDLREREVWLITKESIGIYRELAQHLTVPLHTIFADNRGSQGDEAIEQVIRRFADGQLTVDQFVQELNAKALMMFREGK